MKTSLTEVTALYKLNAATLYKYFYYKTLSRQDAEDLTSETFLQFTKAAAHQKDMHDTTKYLYGIAKHVFTHYLQKKYSHAEIEKVYIYFEEADPYALISEFVQQVESQETLEERALTFIQKLPEKQKQLLTMRLIDKLTPTEISLKINKDTNYVKTTLKRGMKSLKYVIACTPAPTTITEDPI